MRYSLLALLATAACATGTTAGEPGEPDAARIETGAPDARATTSDAAHADAVTNQPDGSAPDGATVVCDAQSGDAAVSPDGPVPDAPVADAALPLDASLPDASLADAAPSTDAGHITQHVDIFIDNFCNVSTHPAQLTIPSGGAANIQWHNHSAYYAADVWMSYGGGYTELLEGNIWDESYQWCAGDSVYTGTADIGPAGVPTTTCAHVSFQISCL